ncbi:MAG: hypothetical protein H7Y38_11190 [Armatimonadetes bacterium]|nr:hypothetical protein [Armatimonadota bacterium]
MQLVNDTVNTVATTAWLETARDTLSRLPLSEHDAALRTLIADWSRRHTGGERLRTNPAWQSFDAFVAEDRATGQNAETQDE